MALALLLSAIVLATVSAAAVIMRRRALRDLILEPVLVTTKTERTFAGLLRHHDRRQIVLVQARLLEKPVNLPIAGELVLPRENIDWMQRGITIDDEPAATAPRLEAV